MLRDEPRSTSICFLQDIWLHISLDKYTAQCAFHTYNHVLKEDTTRTRCVRLYVGKEPCQTFLDEAVVGRIVGVNVWKDGGRTQPQTSRLSYVPV